MANKNDRFYFDNFIEATQASCKAADYLIQCIGSYDPGQIKTMLETMHEIEHTGDQKKHEMSAALAKAFVTPVDREDLDTISQNIDELTDKIEEVLQRFYMDNVTTVPPKALEFAKNVADKIIFLADGEIAEMGTPRQIFDDPQNEKTKAFLHKAEV